MADQLPHNDQNLRLARSIDQAREAGDSLNSLSNVDPLISPLLSYKQQIIDSFKVDEAEKEQTWERIASATREASQTKISFIRSATFRWAAAAVLVIAALTGIFYQQFYQQPELLAASKAAITTVQLSDGSTVTLRPYSQLYLLEYEPSEQRYKLKGEGFFEVIPNAKRMFSVETKTGIVTVLGTSFTLSSWGQKMQVFLKEGSLRVEALKGDSSAVLKPGQSATVADKYSVPVVRIAKGEEFLGWLDQQMIFEKKPVKLIIDELEQQFNISISVEQEIGDKKLTGQLSLENLETSFRDLEIVLGGTFIEMNEGSYIFKAD